MMPFGNGSALCLVLTCSLASPPLAAQNPAAVPDFMLGLWKGTDVPAQSVDVVTGATVALVGWNGQLELLSGNRYHWTEYREGDLGGCRVSTLRKTSGDVTVDGAAIILGAAQGLEAKRDACHPDNSYSNHPVSVPAQRFAVQLTWTVTLGGLETLQLTLTPPGGSGDVLQLTTEPRLDWPAAKLGDPIAREPIPPGLPSLWAWPVEIGRFPLGGAAGFAPPRTDAHWARFGTDGRYEWAGWKADLVPGPGCTVGALVYERGRYQVAAGEYENTLVTQPDSAFVVQRRSGCGAGDGDRAVPVALHPSRYSWSIGRTVDGAEVLEVKCSPEARERNRWQFLLCHWGFEFRSLFTRLKE